jgi:uncharacterized membrane protein YvbJ
MVKMKNPYETIFKKTFDEPKCGTPFIQMEQAEREAYNRMTPEERLEKEKAYEIFKKKENLLNKIRLILLIIIIVGIILLCTQRFWVDSLVNFILQHNS